MKIILTVDEKDMIINYLKIGRNAIQNLERNARKYFFRKIEKFCLRGDELYFYDNILNEYKIVIADNEPRLSSILENLHLPDHTGLKAMYERSKTLYVGFKRESLNNFVSNCLICNRHRPLRRSAPIIPIISEHPWQLVQMDCIDLREHANQNDGYAWILNILDCYSKFMLPVPMKNKRAADILKALKGRIATEGCPVIIQSDNGLEFNNQLLKRYLIENRIRFKRGRPRHPQNQGQVERANQTLTRKLSKCLSSSENKRWIDLLEDVVFKYNTTWHRAINQTPMLAFRNRNGYNRSNPSQVDSISDDFEEEIADFQANLGNYLSTSTEEETSIENQPAPIVSDLPINEIYRTRYISRMVQDADVHYFRITFNPGETVFLVRDFDNNTSTRRRKMDDFFEEGIWTIQERVGDDHFKISKEGNDQEVKIVCKNRLKKINS